MSAENLNHLQYNKKGLINMNEKFFVEGRCYKTPCKTVLTADTFTVNFFTCKHTITANVSDKCYFVSIDNITLSDIKCDFHFSRNYNKPKEFLSKLYDTLSTFLHTSLIDSEKLLKENRHVYKSTDEVLDRILEIVTATDTETTDQDDTTDTVAEQFVYDVVIHNFYGSDTYTVRADGLESAKDKALKIMKNESLDEDYYSIDSIRIYDENSDELLKEIICEPPETEPETETETAETTKPLEIKPKIYFIGSLREKNVERFHVDVVSDNKRIGSCELYIKYNVNGIMEKAICRFLHIDDDFKGREVEIRFLRMLANEYNGIFCVPYDSDDYELYYQIGEECKIPSVFEWSHVVEKCFFISPDKNNERNETDIDNFNKKSEINSMYGLTANTSPEISNKYDESKELLTVKQFERLTRTLFKSLFKAIGLEETRRIPIIISNNMVYFNYNGTQYKYNPAQCKVYKKSGRRYLRINWKEFTDDNSPTDQKQARGRSPPLLLI